MKKLLMPHLVILALALGGNTAFAVQQAFLVQNSGWMEPFYTDEKSQFKDLIVAVAEAASDPSESVAVLSFNQTTPQNESPSLVYQGNAGPQLRQAVAQIQLAHKGAGRTLADTDFNEAVFKTITGPFQSAPGIIWIFTNNKNSPNNSGETAARNREFYNLIHSEPSITRSLAVPLSMPVQGKVYSANGVMIYALAYGAEADERLQKIIIGSRLKQVLSEHAAQLKPLDKDALQVIPKPVVNAPDTSVSFDRDGKTLLLDVSVSSHQPIVLVAVSLKNLFYPYRIKSAGIAAHVTYVNSDGQEVENDLAIRPDTIDDMPSEGAADFTMAVPIETKLPSLWSLASLFDFGRQVERPGIITMALKNQQLAIDESFVSRLTEIFPGDPMPEVFVPPSEARASVQTIPLLIRYNYPLYPLIIALAVLLALLAALIFFLSQLRSAASYEIVADGEVQRVRLGLFEERTIANRRGQPVGVLRRRGWRPKVESTVSGHTLDIRK
jgi:septum formation topological specificity factor MinE